MHATKYISAGVESYRERVQPSFAVTQLSDAACSLVKAEIHYEINLRAVIYDGTERHAHKTTAIKLHQIRRTVDNATAGSTTDL